MRRGLLFILMIGIHVGAFACRFTVREIGFSALSQDIYSLVVIDQSADASDRVWQTIRDRLEDSNIQLAVLHPVKDAEHPFVKLAISNKISLPAHILLSPEGRILKLDANNVLKLVDEVLDSPIRRRLREEFADVFSVILWIDGKDQMRNSEVAHIITEECERIDHIIPYMPKQVNHGPVSIHLPASVFESEKVLIWSLGVDQLPDEPVAFVLYGRGRIMGGAVNTSAISDGRLFKYMSMIGADCECGLDRKWMLGNQIPLLWSSGNRQQLTDEVGFDVDNPMILAEMSRILAKETNPDIANDVGYGIEVIDLNSAFDKVPEINYDEIDSNKKLNPVVITIIAFALLILTTGLFLFYRNRNE